MSRQENLGVVREAFMKRLSRALPSLLVLGLASTLVLGLAGIVPSAQADDDGFTNESIEGVWGFSAAGTTIPVVAVGIMTFDTSGGCVIANVINISGTIDDRISTSCSFTVNPDGTGTITAEFSGRFPGTVPLSFVIVNDGEEFRFIRTDAGVVSGVAKRQQRDRD